MKELIRLRKFSDRLKDAHLLREEIFTALGDDLFRINDTQEFLFRVFLEIDATARTVTKDNKSLTNASNTILKHFGIKNMPRAVVKSLEDSIPIQPQNDNSDPATTFFRYILGLDTLPAQLYDEIAAGVKSDLEDIRSLIEAYEKHEYIGRYKQKNIQPRNHEERLLYDYYRRCRQEQDEILNYYLAGIKERALKRSGYLPRILKQHFDLMNRYRDRPYKFALQYYDSYFDHQKINPLRHRLEDMNYGSEEKAATLYHANKQKFYKDFFKLNTANEVFRLVFFYLEDLPLYNNRKPLFKELQLLFKAKKWYGFYALALSQVEGLFSEMHSMAFPAAAGGRKSLPDKVESVRPFYVMSSYSLDYYQYEIPHLRNKFMHTGFDENLKLKSYDLLLDLHHLVRMFHGMNNPLVKIKKIHRHRSPTDFINASEFAAYFLLIDQLDKSQLARIAGDILAFEKEFLHEYCNAEYVCNDIIQDLPKVLNKFIEQVKNLEGGKTHAGMDITKISQFNALKTDPQWLESIAQLFLQHTEEVSKLEDYNLFIVSHSKFLPSLNNEIGNALDELNKEKGKSLHTIFIVEKELKKMGYKTR